MKHLLHALAFALLLTPFAQSAPVFAEGTITLAPNHLANGSPCLITAAFDTEAATVTGKWQNKHIAFFPSADKKTWYALAGLDVEVKPGTYPIAIEADLTDGHHASLHQ